jgi:cobalamin biosynthesis Co2+ chelatase CbiK
VIQKELASRLQSVRRGEKGLIFVGHGTPDHEAAQVYSECARRITTLFAPPVKAAFGNLESSAPFLGESLGELIMSDIKNLFIQPFMIVDGVHMHDVRGALESQDPDNALYRFLFQRYGEIVKTRLQGMSRTYLPALGSYPGIFELFTDHTVKALSQNDSLPEGERSLNP